MIETERLLLRRWREADVVPFHAMGQDAAVMEFLGEPMTRADAEAAAARQNASIDAHGHGFWALERRDDGRFVGFCGVKHGPDGTPIERELEIGWRLARDAWGRGYASEAARGALAWTWANSERAAVHAITVPANVRSRAVMERIGMARVVGGDFDHPALPEGHALCRHVLYTIARPT